MTSQTTAVPRRASVLPLDGGGWLVREALGDTWQWYVERSPQAGNNAADAARVAAATPGWWPATVPGSAVTALAAAGELPDPYRGRNSRAAEWTGSRSWVFARGVDLPPTAPGERVVLELDGIDPSGTVFWDGRRIGRVDGLYHSLRIELPDPTPGPHRLAVVVDPLPESQPQVGRTERVRVHRPRVTEGWDFCPRLPHQGLWRSARIVIDRVQLAELTVRTELDPAGDGTVRLAGAIEVGDDGPAAIEVAVLDRDGREVAHTVVEPAANGPVRALHPTVPVPSPALWWPRGLGDPVTYTVRVRATGGTRDLWRGTVGFRTARLVANTGAPDGALGYTAEVNGRRLPLVGWNWAPADAQYGALRPERVRHLVQLAADSGARLLRVWGGGLVETEEFYQACDRAGLLVWQEFSQSSSGMQSAPATDPEFVAMLRREARAVVPPRTHHPSLLLWGGGNELDLDGIPLDEDRSPALAALREEVARLDPGRSWLPTSPTGPAFHHRADVIAAAPEDQHDVHGPWEHQGLTGQQALADSGTCLAHTEFGVEGMANRRLMDHLVPAEDVWPLDRSNPVHRHLGEWWDNAPLVAECFGGRLTGVEAYRRASQHLQATGLAYAVEADRRRWPRCSMVLPWQLAESYPNTWCTAVVDHLGDPKPAYHAVARAFAPVRATLRTATTAWDGRAAAEAEVWLWSQEPVAPGSTVLARLRTADGDLLAERRWTVPETVTDPRPAGSLRCPAADLPPATVLLWEVDWTAADGTPLDHELVVASSAPDLTPLLDLPPATVRVRTQATGPDAATVTMQHLTGPAVVGLTLLDTRPAGAPGWTVIDGDPRPLLPGELRRLAVRWTDTDPTAPRSLAVEAWNLPPQPVDLPDTDRPHPEEPRP
ncbi:glycoside hydrolase family 2 protein [Cellulomonas denverensis]|uniref:glycoside hydrolase family 2 protein n=1 Tax=Cellulomonas denverensis TaxID=264297 RepID=UPI00194207B0|nr:glycoside hydrolase family 2 TIM barrel-domain containing protein [Cellulomonas denverensis]GIG26684.1 hypothetical protein Cde04nite_29280 [Cellulomonas denverensis]